ncbi:unnamed protein product [Caenorhabditis auriculariae]|uniref:MAM domain-containing protein n=1 Tax=Caenorhabditis auriculariae TaxID=2777116 RepID=A0A8S1H587_9PELO|nr:unnamed protein product [Caenorhabditis auriculariae]
MDRVEPLDIDYSTDLRCRPDYQPYTFNDSTQGTTSLPPIGELKLTGVATLGKHWEEEEQARNQIRSAASIHPLSDDPQLAVDEGGRVTCSFDNSQEFCSWHNAPETVVKRIFFLLAGGEPVLSPQTVALETNIPCQYGNAVVNFWASSDTPILRQCVSRDNGNDVLCEDILPMPNPVNFSVAQSMTPIRVRIEVVNVGTNDVILIDNIMYEGQICELIDEEEPTVVSTETPLLPSSTTPSAVQKFFEDEDILNSNSFGITQNSVSTTSTSSEAPTTTSPSSESPPEVMTSSVVGELSPCVALTCTFNDGDSCFYGLSGIGSTVPWQLASRLLGNRHTGIQRIDVLDQSQVGFVYVGSDSIGYNEDLFVMESPKFSLKEDVVMVFDIYLRSYYPRLKVCVDSFDDCPYFSSSLDKKEHWHFSQKVPLTAGVRKVYFVASNIARHQFLAVDNIRLENADGIAKCPPSTNPKNATLGTTLAFMFRPKPKPPTGPPPMYLPGSIQIPTRYYPGTIEIVPGRIQMTTDYDSPIDWSCYPVHTCIYLSSHQCIDCPKCSERKERKTFWLAAIGLSARSGPNTVVVGSSAAAVR